MPVRIIGRPTTLRGKYLFEILRNLKNFGIGRVVARTIFERYPEPSYYVVNEVFPKMDPDGQHGSIKAEFVFRGRNLGVQKVIASYKADWRLIPKEEEEAYKNLVRPGLEQLPAKRIVPAAVPFPPLLRRMQLDELKQSGKEVEGELQLPLVIHRRNHNHPIQEGVEVPLGAAKQKKDNPINTILPQSMAGHLFLSNRKVSKS